MSCGVGCRRGSDPALLWLWRRPVATALIQPLAWEPPYAAGAAQEIATITTTTTNKKKKKKKRQKTKKKKKKKTKALSFFFFFWPFLGPLPRHMEAPRLEVESELKPLAYTTATATWDPSHVCDLHHSSRQRRIPNPLSEARDRTCNLMVPGRIRCRCTTTGTPCTHF